MKATTNIFLLCITVLLASCAGEMTTAKMQFQNDSTAILKDYTRGVSKYFPRRTASRGFTGPTMAFNETPVGGYMMRPITDDVQDCLEWVESIDDTKAENYQFMVGAFSRCLNRILGNRNPMMSAYSRALPGQGQWDLSWANAWRQTIPVDYWGSQQYNTYLPQMQSGYSNTQDVLYSGGF